MSPTYQGAAAPSTPDNSLLLHVFQSLAAMPPGQRNARILLFDRINSMPGEELALIAKFVQWHLTDQEIAQLCGVCLKTVKQRWRKYGAYKPALEDYVEWMRTRRLSNTDDIPA